MEMILSGKLHPGQDAARLGLVHRAVPDDGLEQGVDDLLKPILRNPAYALSLAKRAVKAGPGPVPWGRGSWPRRSCSAAATTRASSAT